MMSIREYSLLFLLAKAVWAGQGRVPDSTDFTSDVSRSLSATMISVFGE